MAVVTFSLQPPDASLALVGEAGFQETLDRFSGGRDEDGAVFPHHAAVLVAEPDNRYDRDAVAVYICDEAGEAEQVGYLSQESAIAYGPILELVTPKLPMCLLTIQGGWDRGPDDRRYHSAFLNVGSPAEMAAEWCVDNHPPRRDHPWRGTTVAFVGRSPFAIGGVELDRAGRVLLASHAGCRTRPRVGPGVGLCVVGQPELADAGPDGDRQQLQEAREHGIERLAEDRFWQDLGYPLEVRAGP